MRTRIVLGFLLLVVIASMICGCSAQKEATLTGGDAIQAATKELRTGVDLYDKSVQANIAKTKAGIYRAALIEFGKTATQSADSPEQRAESLMKAIDDLVVEEGRRNELRLAMLDNIAFIEKIAIDLQKLTIYSANVDNQMKDWMQSQIKVKAATSAVAK